MIKIDFDNIDEELEKLKFEGTNESKSDKLSTIDKINICLYTSQINEIVQQLSIEYATEQLNELKNIEETINLQKINNKILNQT